MPDRHNLSLTTCHLYCVSVCVQGVLHVFDLNLQRPDHIKVPVSSYTTRMLELLETGEGADVIFQVGH